MPSTIPNRMAVHDPDRKGFLIPAAELTDTPLNRGDRFAVGRGRQPLFTLTLQIAPDGDILFDVNGIFIPRTRLVDAMLGGIYDQVVVEIDPAVPNRIRLRPPA